MKLFLFTLFFISFYMVQSQKKLSTIFYRDGATKECIATIRKGKILIFNEKGGKEKLDHRKVSKIIYKPVVGTGTFVYKIREGYSGVMLIELIKKGRINLYGVYNPPTTFNGTTTGGNTFYFLGKENENTITNFEKPKKYGNNNFLKEALDFFSNCEGLVKKIKEKEFKRLDLPQIAEYFNSNCAN